MFGSEEVKPEEKVEEDSTSSMTALRFTGTTAIRMNKSDVNKAPWTAEFWLKAGGLSMGHRLASSDNCSCKYIAHIVA